MAYYDGLWTVLSPVEAENFLYSISHPDLEIIERRDAFFAELDQMPFVQNADGSFEIEFELAPAEKRSISEQHSFVATSKENMFINYGEMQNGSFLYSALEVNLAAA